MPKKPKSQPPFETAQLRAGLRHFFKLPYLGGNRTIGSFKWGVYIFYDYDGEPIYVGQTKEKVSGRIGRHLTNQRTDAVAMSVLDPFEVFEIEVFPLPQFEEVSAANAAARDHLDALEYENSSTCDGEEQIPSYFERKRPTATKS